MVSLPLRDVRIVEFDGLGPVTFAGMMLADMGAEILRITRPGAGMEVGGAVTHRGRETVTADLKSPADLARVRELVLKADAVIEGFRPGVMERLGLGPETVQAENPRLVFGRVTGWGQSGPLADQAGHDLNYMGLTGALFALGPADVPPPPPLNLVADYGGGAMMLVCGVLAGVVQARDSGKGCVVDAAMTDGVALLSGLHAALRRQGLWTDQRQDNLLDGAAPFYRCYRCLDGKYLAVAAIEPPFYARLMAGLGLDEPQTMDRHQWPGQIARFAARIETRDRDDWAAAFEGRDACVTPVLDWAEAQAHPHNLARGTYIDGLPAAAPRFDGNPFPATMSGAIALDQAVSRWVATV